MGVPSERMSVPRMFMRERSRALSMLRSSVGPSTPKLAEWFTFVPSLLFSPFASLCLWS